MREDFLKSAVEFLKDPKVQSASYARKAQFLESKGLTNEEIEEAFRRVKENVPTTATPIPQHSGQPTPNPTTQVQPGPGQTVQPYYPYVPQQSPSLLSSASWKDYFIGTVLVGGALYGVGSLVVNHILPSISWPSKEDIKKDRELMEQKFKQTTETFNAVQEQTAGLVENLNKQNLELQKTLVNMEEVLSALRKANEEKERETESLKEEVERLKNTIPKELDKYALSEVQTELKSLKGLLLNRRQFGGANGVGGKPIPVASAPSFAGRYVGKTSSTIQRSDASGEQSEPTSTSTPTPEEITPDSSISSIQSTPSVPSSVPSASPPSSVPSASLPSSVPSASLPSSVPSASPPSSVPSADFPSSSPSASYSLPSAPSSTPSPSPVASDWRKAEGLTSEEGNEETTETNSAIPSWQREKNG
eukprot:Lithocolla_globosa_v1_NODE_3453_length_1665_cov_8.464596.p1 type:complete len:419 gc:universal NODE_3453_length_1665_cov_8.464596:1325-69(-)